MQAYGAPGRIRTCDHLLRRQMLYPTELQALECLNVLTMPIKNPIGFKWSEWRDSNPRPSAPKADALPSCATLRFYHFKLLYQLVVVVRIIQLRLQAVNH